MNKIFLTGNLGRDAELKTFANGGQTLSFSIATSEKWTSKDGEKRERTDWHRCELGGDRGAKLAQYLTKGMKLSVIGSMHYREFEKDGIKRTAAEIRVDEIEFLGGGSKDSNDRGSSKPAARSGPADDDGFVGDDIPF